jgi:hypothetical protein
VPKQRWHLASLAGDGMSARLALNGYPDLVHSFEERDATSTRDCDPQSGEHL